MNKIIITFLFLLVVFNLDAQVDLSVSYNNIHSGNSMLILCSKKINPKYELGGGIRFNINSKEQGDDQNNVFYDRLYATEPYQYFGIDAHINRYIFLKMENVKPFIFYDLQLAYSTTHNRFFNPIGQLTNGNYVYEETITGFGPFLWVENYVGVGFKVDLYESFFLTQRLGFGVDLIFGYDEYLSQMAVEKFAWEFGGIIDVGFGYRF
jgi:hypothetical protein